MEKPFILIMKEAKKDIADTINNYINAVPAEILADYLQIMVTNLRQVAEQQTAEAMSQFQTNDKKTE